MTEYLLPEHFDMVEKVQQKLNKTFQQNRSTKIGLLENRHLLWSQILSGYVIYLILNLLFEKLKFIS